VVFVFLVGGVLVVCFGGGDVLDDGVRSCLLRWHWWFLGGRGGSFSGCVGASGCLVFGYFV